MSMILKLLTGVLIASGVCGCSGEKQSALTGKVVYKDGSEMMFHSDSIELQSVSNPQHFAYGQLSEQGEFEVESLISGEIVRGAPAGKYRVRFIVSDDDIVHKKDLLSKIDKRFLDYETSGWNAEVPGSNVILELAGPR
ncbi:MAG: hypothetical protein ACOYKN_10490 [Pirellula sp.]